MPQLYLLILSQKDFEFVEVHNGSSITKASKYFGQFKCLNQYNMNKTNLDQKFNIAYQLFQ